MVRSACLVSLLAVAGLVVSTVVQAAAEETCPPGVPRLDLGSGSALPGEEVTLPINLVSVGAQVGLASNKLAFSTSQVSFVSSQAGAATLARNGSCSAQGFSRKCVGGGRNGKDCVDNSGCSGGNCTATGTTELTVGCLTLDLNFFDVAYVDGKVVELTFRVEQCPQSGVIQVTNAASAATAIAPAADISPICGLDGQIECGPPIVTTTTTTSSTTTTTVPPLDHFLCYKVKATKGEEKFQKILGVSLADQFEDKKFDVEKVGALCNPVNKNGEGIGDKSTHLKAYQIKEAKLCSNDGSSCVSSRDCAEGARCGKVDKHVKRANILVSNQLGDIVVGTVKPLALLVPSAKDLNNPPQPPDPGSHNVDHFKCYKVKVRKKVCLGDLARGCKRDDDCGQDGPCFVRFPRNLQVTLEDQFISAPKVFDVKKPTKLCTPVDKNGEGKRNPDAHLMCYKVKQTKGRCVVQAPQNAGGGCKKETDCGGENKVTDFCVRQVKHEKVVGVYVNNQFGPEVLDVVKEKELCVPSQKQLPAGGLVR